MLRLANNKRITINPRRLTNVGEILKGENAKKKGKRKGAKRPKPLESRTPVPTARLALTTHQQRKQRYLDDLSRRYVDA